VYVFGRTIMHQSSHAISDVKVGLKADVPESCSDPIISVGVGEYG
jgi:hypothetical protein